MILCLFDKAPHPLCGHIAFRKAIKDFSWLFTPKAKIINFFLDCCHPKIFILPNRAIIPRINYELMIFFCLNMLHDTFSVI